MLIERRLMPCLSVVLAIAFALVTFYIWDDLQASWQEVQVVWEYINPPTSNQDKETSP